MPAPFCPDLLAFLAAMSAETRDDAWAGDMETRIRKAMQIGGRLLVDIRSLECRGQRCALEYAADLPTGEGQTFDGIEDLLRFLQPVTGGMGYELGVDGAKPKVIAVICWQRL